MPNQQMPYPKCICLITLITTIEKILKYNDVISIDKNKDGWGKEVNSTFSISELHRLIGVLKKAYSKGDESDQELMGKSEGSKIPKERAEIWKMLKSLGNPDHEALEHIERGGERWKDLLTKELAKSDPGLDRQVYENQLVALEREERAGVKRWLRIKLQEGTLTKEDRVTYQDILAEIEEEKEMKAEEEKQKTKEGLKERKKNRGLTGNDRKNHRVELDEIAKEEEYESFQRGELSPDSRRRYLWKLNNERDEKRKKPSVPRYDLTDHIQHLLADGASGNSPSPIIEGGIDVDTITTSDHNGRDDSNLLELFEGTSATLQLLESKDFQRDLEIALNECCKEERDFLMAKEYYLGWNQESGKNEPRNRISLAHKYNLSSASVGQIMNRIKRRLRHRGDLRIKKHIDN